jgi:cyanophycin synthetase
MLYPERAPCRVPVVAVLQQPGETLDATIHTAASMAGQRIARVSAERLQIGSSEPLVVRNRLHAIEAAGLDGTVDAVVVGVTAQDIVRSGLGLDRIDLAIVPPDPGGANRQAAEALERLARGRVIASDDPQLLPRALATLSAPARSGDLLDPPQPEEAALATPAAPRAPKHDAGGFTLMLTGDVGFGESYSHGRGMAPLRRLLAAHGHQQSLARLKDLLGAADLLVGNLEVPLAPTINPALEGRKNYLGWSEAEETLFALKEAGFDAVSLANNHVLDCGEAGLHDTIRLLDDAEIVPFGAGATLAAARKPFIRKIRVGPVERTIVVFGCFEYRARYAKHFAWYAGSTRPGVNPIAPTAIARRIERLRATLTHPIFIAYPHWGIDYRDTENYQRVYAEELTAAGVDLIIGHGAHALQGLETVAGRPVLYGLGNLAFNSSGRFAQLGAPPFGLVAALQFRCAETDVSMSLRLYPLLIDNRVTEFQNRPVSSTEFPEAVAALTRNFDQPHDALVRGSDRFGHYIELGLDTPPAPLASVMEMPTSAAGVRHQLAAV